MRVALLTHNAQAGDAIGNQVAEKLAFFLERGADVRVFLESDKRLHPAVRTHCRVLHEPKPQGDSWEFLSSADLVIVDYGQYYRLLELFPLLAAGSLRKRGTSPSPQGDSPLFRPRILFDYHGVTPAELWQGHNCEALEIGARQRGLVWCADAALVHSRFTCQELGDQTAFPAERLSLIEYPVDTRHFCPGSPRRHLRDELGLKDASLLLFVGRVAPNKRIPVAIDALDRLRDLMPQVHLVIVGDITDVYQVEASLCRQRAAELGLADRVHLLGQVREDQLLDAYRSADLFVMPSRHEGFCIPVLEAMACGLPVVPAGAGALPETVADAGLTFAADDPGDLARQVRRVLVRSDASRGHREEKGNALAERMRRQGLLHAARHERSAWRERFGRIIEELLDSPPRPKRDVLEVRPRSQSRTVCAGAESVLVPVRIANRGTHAALSEGPGRILLRSLVADELGQPCGLPALDTPLPGLLIPGQEAAAAMRVPVPATVGVYQVALFAVSQDAEKGGTVPCFQADNAPAAPSERRPAHCVFSAEPSFRLIVEPAAAQMEDRSCAASLQLVQRALVEAECKQHLPADYIDVSQGLLAKWKRWIKRKLLGNFKHAYVDVLSRQQSAFNRQTLTALQELAECCALLDHALARGQMDKDPSEADRLTRAFADRDVSSLAASIDRAVATGKTAELALLLHDLLGQLAEARQRFAALEARLNRLEGVDSRQ